MYLIWKEREMFYLTTHSTHFIYGYMASDIWLRTTHTTAFVTPVVEHWLEREITQWVHVFDLMHNMTPKTFQGTKMNIKKGQERFPDH